jgi:hypothetical protein
MIVVSNSVYPTEYDMVIIIYGVLDMLRAHSQVVVELNITRNSRCRGSKAICGYGPSLRANSHHSSLGITTIIFSPYIKTDHKTILFYKTTSIKIEQI